MNTELKDLIGAKVLKLYINQEFLVFETDKGNFTYEVTGDCCSHSYFYDFYGVKNLLRNGPIVEIKAVELNPTDVVCINGNSDDLTQVYGFQITTESIDNWGPVTSVFSFRNHSNGYYGGGIEKIDRLIPEMPELLGDIVEIK